MSNIAVPAVHLSAQNNAAKTPAKGEAAAGGAKPDFALQLTLCKTAAKTVADTNPAIDADNVADTAPGNAKPLAAAAAFLHTAPQQTSVSASKTAKPGRREPASKTPATPAATAAINGPGLCIAPPPQAAAPNNEPVAATSQIVPQTHATTPQTPKPAAVEASAKTVVDAAAPNNQASPAASPAITASPPLQGEPIAASHKAAALTHTRASTAITAQLADALPHGAAKPGASLALHIALQPETLGAVNVKIQHSGTDNTNVTITASQPETLETMKKDVASLNQILTNAGIPEAGRQIEFRAAPVTAPQPGAGLGNADNTAMQNPSGGRPAPQNGTGFANSSVNSPVTNSAPAALPAPATAGGLDMIA